MCIPICGYCTSEDIFMVTIDVLAFKYFIPECYRAQ